MAGITFTEVSGLNDSVYGKVQYPIRAMLEKRGEAFEQKSLLKNLFQMNSSNHFGEMVTSMTAMDGFQAVGELGAYPVDSMQEGYSKFLQHMTWKDSFSLSEEVIEDSKNIDLKKKPAAFIAAYYRTREKYGAFLYGNAIQAATSATFGGKAFDLAGADTLALFHAAHTSKVSSATQCNLYADAFSDDALGMMESAMQGFKGDNGEILDVAPDTILIPNSHTLKKAVFAAIGADKDPDTANNGYNYQFGRWTVIISAYLNGYIGSTNTAPWVLLDSKYNDLYGGAIWYDRTPLKVRSTIDENTDANVWRGKARFVAGFNDWRFAACGGINGATALS